MPDVYAAATQSHLSITISHVLLLCCHARSPASFSQLSSSALSLFPPGGFQKYYRSKQQPPPMQHGLSNGVRYLLNRSVTYRL